MVHSRICWFALHRCGRVIVNQTNDYFCSSPTFISCYITFVLFFQPYVKFEIEQDNMLRDKDYGEQKSTIKKDELNPVYDETFHFNIPTLNNMVLTVTIKDDDIMKDEKIGKCKIKLEGMGLSASPTHVQKKVDNKLFRKDAFVFLSLTYTE